MVDRSQPCAVDGCENTRSSTLVCGMHYSRWRTHGSYDLSARPSAEERFWAKVDRRGDDECWLWTASTMARGYGQFAVGRTAGKAKFTGAHRYSWSLANGEAVPDGMDVCHTCDTPACVNPAHLFVGTRSDNMRDMSEKGRSSYFRRTHCTHGHEWTPENTLYRRTEGHSRRCRECARQQSERKNAKARIAKAA